MSTLHASVAAGEPGPLIVLSGEADITNTPQLSELLDGQLARGPQSLTVAVARMLEILGAQQLLAIRDETEAAPGTEP